MNTSILILGTGKMACNIGAFFLKRGHSVYWVSENEEFLGQAEKKIKKEVRRIHRVSPEHSEPIQYDLITYDQAHNIPSIDVIIESTTEDLAKKQRAISQVNHLLHDKKALLLSTSSSLLPGEINTSCIGCHFFYPVELTGFVEIIFPRIYPDNNKAKVIKLVEQLSFISIIQSDNNAFAANRLLLPLQAEVFRLLAVGHNPDRLNNATMSEILPFGQLEFMDSVGLDVIFAGVKNYVRRMPQKIQGDYNPLLQGLEGVISLGKLGKKVNNGLLCGESLPWLEKTTDDAQIKNYFLYLFIHTCQTFIKSGHVSRSSLDLIMSSVFNSDISFSEAEKEISHKEVTACLDTFYKETNLTYFKV